MGTQVALVAPEGVTSVVLSNGTRIQVQGGAVKVDSFYLQELLRAGFVLQGSVGRSNPSANWVPDQVQPNALQQNAKFLDGYPDPRREADYDAKLVMMSLTSAIFQVPPGSDVSVLAFNSTNSAAGFTVNTEGRSLAAQGATDAVNLRRATLPAVNGHMNVTTGANASGLILARRDI